MNVLVYLVPTALALGLTGLFAFLWSLKNGQYDDLDGAALRILLDDDERDAGSTGKTGPKAAHDRPAAPSR